MPNVTERGELYWNHSCESLPMYSACSNVNLQTLIDGGIPIKDERDEHGNVVTNARENWGRGGVGLFDVISELLVLTGRKSIEAFFNIPPPFEFDGDRGLNILALKSYQEAADLLQRA